MQDLETVFTGRFDRQVDAKGRLALPVEFRNRLGHRCFLALGDGGCVSVFSPQAFGSKVEEVREKVRSGELPQSHFRTLTSSAFEMPLDGQGRVSLVEDLRVYAEVDPSSTVTVIGVWDHIEIWNPGKFAAVQEAGQASLAAGA